MSSKGSERHQRSDGASQYMKKSAPLLVSALIFMGAMSALVYTNTIRLYPSSMNSEMVKGYGGRVEFALRYQTLLVAWLMFNVVATMAARGKHRAVNPLDESTEESIMPVKLTLNNSYEQIVLSVFAQLIFVSFATPECILKTIPLVNILQFVGRIAFFYGYPMKRGFGFMCTVIPTFILITYNIYGFVTFLVK